MAGIDCSRIRPVGEDCECQCPDGGWCEPHQIEKTSHYVHLCRTREPYRRAWNECRGPRQGFVNPYGPGSELRRMLGCDALRGDPCKWGGRFKVMDDWGPDGCVRNIGTVVTWLEEFPMDNLQASRMVELAIRQARKRKDLGNGYA